MRVTIQCPEIPEYLRENMSMQKAAATFLEHAVTEQILPATTVTEARPLQVIISQSIYDALVPPGSANLPTTLGSYVQGVLDLKRQNSPSPALAERITYQRRYYEAIAPLLTQRRIVMAEAATGIGKGRVGCRFAKENSDAGRGPVAIAAPSVAVVKQLIDEWIKSGYPLHSVSCVLGKQQFVDAGSLQQILTADDSPVAAAVAPETRERILSWIGNDCSPIKGNPNTAPIVALAPLVSCLDADLLFIAPEMEPFGNHYLLNEFSDPEDSGSQAYAELRELAYDAEIVFCTHAMIGYDLLSIATNKTRLLPDYTTIIIDEAHLFEKNLANIFTHNISIQGLRAALQKTEAGNNSARKTCMNLCSEIMEFSSNIDTGKRYSRIYYNTDFSGEGKDSKFVSDRERHLFATMVRLRDALAEMLKKSRKKDPRLSVMLGALHKIAACAKGFSKAFPVLFDNTPIRKWPVLSTGKKSVEKELKAVWEKAKNGAVLMSATLSVPSGRSECEHNRDYIYEILHIPPERGVNTPPVIPRWVIETPTLCIPAPDRADLCYPSEEEETYKDRPDELLIAKAAWRVAVADEIEGVVSTAVGGTLVLACSYEDIVGIGGSLSAKLGERLILKTQQASLEQQKQQFKTLARVGKRPVWLAVGTAWTGLDLRDEIVSDDSPEKDIILTDLIVPRINFSDNQTITHLFRSRGSRVGSGRFTEAAFTLRQGLGRLVRRPGLPNRRLWFLDNRVWLKGKNYNVFRHILGAYPKKSESVNL